MYMQGFSKPIAGQFHTLLNNQTVRIYKGTMPISGDAYDAVARSADLLIEATLALTYFESVKLTVTQPQAVTPTGTGLATWFVLTNLTTNEVMMSDVGTITSNVETLILNDTNVVTGVANSIDDFEIDFSDVVGVL